jgi:biuret amidohydrolase
MTATSSSNTTGSAASTAQKLDIVLRGAGIDTLVLTGVATNLAVESTARAGADLGYRIVVAADGCATTSESAHDASLASLAMFTDVVSIDDLVARYDSRAEAGLLERVDEQGRS